MTFWAKRLLPISGLQVNRLFTGATSVKGHYKLNYSRLIARASPTALALAAFLALLNVVFPCQAQAQPSAKIVRPRMLIGEHDALTGFTILRARYAAGARPSDDIAGWALSYLLTRDDSFARHALEEMRRTLQAKGRRRV